MNAYVLFPSPATDKELGRVGSSALKNYDFKSALLWKKDNFVLHSDWSREVE